MPWTYHQRSGQLYRAGRLVATGYSGHGEGLNNPEQQHIAGVGPIPRGRWIIDGVYNSAEVGPYALVVHPEVRATALGRSAFRIHGDNSKGNRSASRGCIILTRPIREKIWQSADRVLIVEE